MAILNNSNAISAGGYTINNSVRLRSSASAYLTRTPASAGNRKTWTYSTWVKRGALGSSQTIFSATGANSDTTQNGLNFQADDTLRWTGYATAFRISTQVFRDPSAWYHIVIQFDSTQATATDRVRLYVNGTQITSFSTNNTITLNADYAVNQATAHEIGRFTTGGVSIAYLDGYQAEVNFIDGQALTPSSFGQTSATTGVWQPKAYTGTYGTNGFYLKFSDIATTSGSNAGLGKDFSGNGNYWTTNNISVTSGTTYDAMIDSPTNTASGTQPVGNYCTLNPLWKGANVTLSEGNLKFLYSGANGYDKGAVGTQVISSKSYWEVTDLCTAIGTYGNNAFGIIAVTASPNISFTTGSCVVVRDSGNLYRNGTADPSGTGAPYASGSANDIYMFAYDPSTTTLWIGRNGTWFNSGNPASGTGSVSTVNLGDVVPFITGYQAGDFGGVINFGQRPFAYTPPSGFKSICTTNLPDSTIVQGNKYMDATLYTGTGAVQSITNAGSFKPDFVWLKYRSVADNHYLYNSVVPSGYMLMSNSTAAEQNLPGVTSFNSNGFSLAATTYGNANTGSYVGWQWQAGQGTTSSNTSGSITSTVSVNATAGFSIVTFTGDGASGTATVGHGLGVVPAMVIEKQRSTTGDWMVKHKSMASGNNMFLDTTNAQSAPTVNGYIADLTSSTTFGLTRGSSSGLNVNVLGTTYVAYCFAEIAGFSKFGSYTGNGSADGPFVFTNFLPKYVMIKRTDSTGDWIIMDTSRNTYNSVISTLAADTSGAESNYTAGNGIDYLSNGFKLRDTGIGINASGGNYIYAAFASNPYKVSLAR